MFPGPRTGPRGARPALAAVATVRCGQAHHRVGVTVRGQAVMLDHDRKLERLAVGIEAEARTECARVYDALRASLATTAPTTRDPSDAAIALAAHGEDDDDLVEYLRGAVDARRRRADRAAHTTRLTQISVLAGGPPLLPDWAHLGKPSPFRNPDGITLQGLKHARRDVLDRIVPELFLGAGYPIVARHPPAQPGVRRGACWHVTVGELGPTDVYPIATAPHPSGHGRVCHSVTVPLATDWYRDVYRAGAAVIDGCLVCKLGPPGSGGGPKGDAYGALLLVQQGARMRLEDHAVVPTPSGWRRRTPGALADGARPAGGTGVRPSPWD